MVTNARFASCCCQVQKKLYITHAAAKLHVMARDTDKCPFCREPVAKSDKEHVARCYKRMEAGDATASKNLGAKYFEGSFGLP